MKRCETRNSLCGSLSTRLKDQGLDAGEFGVSLKPSLPRNSNGGSCGSCNRNERVEESYGKHEAVKWLNVAVEDGSVCAFLAKWCWQEFDDKVAPWHDPSNVGHWQHFRPQD